MYRLIVLFFLISAVGIAQETSYITIDSESYELYQKKEWQKLATWSEGLSGEEVNYYYFNVRVGEAYFNLKKYYKAEQYFTKALKNNTTDYVLAYLYSTYINLGQINQAKEIHAQLSDEAKNTIVNKTKLLESVYVEGGQKFSNNIYQNDLSYYSLSLSHRFSNKLTLAHSIGKVNQNSKEDSNNLLQYTILPSYYLKKGYSVQAGFMYNQNNNIRSSNVGGVQSKTDSDIVSLVYHAATSKQYGRLYGELYGYYITQNLNGTWVGSSIPPETFSIYAYTGIVGLNAVYTLPFFNDRFSVGAKVFTAYDDETTNLFVSPTLITVISPKIAMKTMYYSVNKTLFADKESGIVFSNSNIKTERFANTITYTFNSDFQFIVTYSHENIIQDVPGYSNRLNSFFLGINYIL